MGTRDIAAKLNFHKGLVVRAAGFGFAAATLCGALAAGSVLRNPERPPAPSVAVPVEEGGKNQARVAGDRSSAAIQIVSAITNVSVWHPDRMENVPPGESTGGLAPALSDAEPGGEWREQEFASVTVLDGRSFSAGGLTIRLTDLELPPSDQVCRTLDNRLEQCATRATTQLELITRSRTLACRYRMTTSSEGIGSCRIGTHDLAQRMVRTGYVRLTGAGRTVLANAKANAAPPR